MGLADVSFDVVLHLAASLDYFGDARRLFEANVRATEHAVRFARERGIRRLVLASSVEAAGPVAAGQVPADERVESRPVSPYGASKLEAERVAERAARQGGVELCVLRLANVYGKGSPSFVVPIVEALEHGGPLLRFLPHYAERYLHPIHVDDAAAGIVAALEPGAPTGTFHLAGDEPVRTGDLFARIARVAGIGGELLETNAKTLQRMWLNARQMWRRRRGKADLLSYFWAADGERVHRAYSIARAQNELAFRPRIRLDDGLEETLAWARDAGFLRPLESPSRQQPDR